MANQQTTFKTANSALSSQSERLGLPGWLVILAIVYNAFLAIINAHVMTLGSAHVAVTEALILGMVLAFLLFHLKDTGHPASCFISAGHMFAVFVGDADQ